MGFFFELRSRARYIIGPVLGLCASGYFAYHAIHGERGLFALRQLTQRVMLARADFDRFKNEREDLESRVRLLHPDSLDPDMLDERARAMLNYGYDDEIVVLPDTTVLLPDRKKAED